MDIDRNIIKGIKGNKLTAYNFSWSLSSGYGLFKENYLTYNKAQNVFVMDDHSITIMNFVPANTFAAFRYDTDLIKATKVRVTGLTATDQLTYEYSPSDGGSRAVFPIPEDGEYDLPESIQKSVGGPRYNVGFAVRGALTKNVTIEQIPEYEGAIVTDGIDDYLKLDKVEYDFGTVIIKYFPIPTVDRSQYVFDILKERNFLAYNNKISVENNSPITNFLTSRTIGDYYYGKNSTPKKVSTSLFLGSNTQLTEQMSVALYDIAIYQDILTEEEILNEIDKMNKYKLIADYVFNKNNNDADRDYVINQLNPNERINLLNFDYVLGSGYGLYKENYNNVRQLSGITGVFSNTDYSIHITNVNKVNIPITEIPYKAGEFSPEYQIKVTGLLEGQWCNIGYYYNYLGDAKPPVQENLINIPKDGIYTVPSFTFPSDIKSGTSTRIVFNFAGDTDITIEQIPEYPNHLVFDGTDDTTEPIPNLNSIQGTIMIQYDPMEYPGNILSPIDENGISMYRNSFIISSSPVKGTLQARSDDEEIYANLNTPLGNNISAFAYDDLGINLYNNQNIRETFYVNKHSKYIFAKDASTNWYRKLALKRIKIFDRKLTRNQLDIEYNKLLNE